jgi:DNA-directed RNA polymerase
VLEIVKREVSKDSLIPIEISDELQRRKGACARLVKDILDRKVIKQTVMTSVYGVTSRGAKDQVFNR